MANVDRIGVLVVATGLILASCSSRGGTRAAAGSSSTAPPTPAATTTTAPVSPSSFLLGASDLAGYSPSAQPAPTPLPCGYHFGDTSTATSEAAAFATAGSQQTVKETVALYPSPAAATSVATSFRTTGASCSQFDDTTGPTTTYQVRALTAPAVPADDVVAVSLASPAHFYDLVLLRSGARLAWLALGQIGNPVDGGVFTSITSAAARRLAP